MKVFIASEVSEVFASNNFDLLFGAGWYSMMGECYKTFRKHKRKMYAYTVPKWERDFKRIPKAKCVRTSDTLLRFRKLYFRADVIVILPGGIGTLAEFASAVEEYRTSGGDKRIILYNFDGYYDGLIKWFKDNIETGFFIDDFSDCFDVVTSIDELNSVVDSYKRNVSISKKFK